MLLGFLIVFWSLVHLGQAHSPCKFLHLFRFPVFLHSSCSVVISYFMFILKFVILLFSVTMFQWLKLGKSVCTILPRVAHFVIWHLSWVPQIDIHSDWKITKYAWALLLLGSILHIFQKKSQHNNCLKLNLTTQDLLTFAEQTFCDENKRFPSKPNVVLSVDLSEVQQLSLFSCEVFQPSSELFQLR